jgi:RNA polymerase sigma-70 factor (ECF subfamily)
MGTAGGPSSNAGAGTDLASDAQLLELWRAGDRRAGNQLVRRYHVPVSGFFKNAVGDDERQDLVQETFRGLTTAKDAFRGDGGVRSFVFGIARKVLLDHLRKRYRESKHFDPLTHTVEDVDGATPSQVVAELQRSHRLLTCLRALPVDIKQLLELYYWQGLTAEELGRVFAEPGHVTESIPPGTIRRRIHDAKQKLRACLEAGGAASPAGEDRAEELLEDELRVLGQVLVSGPSAV